MAEETKKTAKKAPAAKKAAPKAEKPVEEVAAAEAPKAEKPAKKAAKKAAPKAEKPAEEAPKAEKPAKKAAKKPAKKEEPKPEPVAPKAPVTEAHAFARDVRITPRKVRLVCDLVRGKDVKDALAILAITNKVAVSPVEKIIRSAAANAVNNFGMDESKLYISEIQASDGLKIKRFIPRAKGSASGIVKRNANIRITVKERK